MEPGEAGILEREGCQIHFWLHGSPANPLVVLTHGACIDHRTFDPQVAVLAARYRVLTWDMRGHGLSRSSGIGFTCRKAVADLIALLDHVGSEQAILIGQSIGGNVTQELIFSYPERAKALVMIDCTCNTLSLSVFERLLLLSAPLLLRLYPYETLKRQSAKASSTKPEVREYLYQAFSTLSKEAFVAILTSGIECLHYEPGYRITQPLLLTHGIADGTGNIRKVAPRWAERDPRCTYVVIPEAGHVSNQDNPEYFNRVLLDFLSQR
jgi:pimeloyl-ACP methyl ester carboxylesterase